jgi:hypothetical protein
MMMRVNTWICVIAPQVITDTVGIPACPPSSAASRRESGHQHAQRSTSNCSGAVNLAVTEVISAK